nr:MAG TPA_asm: hypothetical protein [Caudoviricetes sp.]
MTNIIKYATFDYRTTVYLSSIIYYQYDNSLQVN